ncbi:Cof-type HAD-IIB family hydrolase [Streptomyces sp. SID335]|uniref:Hydrolase n=1 Tax=Streptomyces venezuelae TaxID=54571 RepID=A0A5P2BDR9_STRVZ|nr:Cof-type HAD-IIB family hydrolase [Streptomyces sp. SID335]MYZ13971.1 Cof-type HAD-IIB family hydrolase [Streptomyces sp. SID337]NDZ91196.1 HAD family phosphatase [Streptomyces sp. SID10115]NEB49586.1 HAD family phosphatase [Streptomyces sp. SID339]QES28197.1 hydrolase [Streptomyces venezuelae]
MCAPAHARAAWCGTIDGVTSATPGPRAPAPFAPAAGSPAAPRPRCRLIATDLDGTLLRDDKTVSDRTVAALAAAEAAGIEVFFVTGRPARWMDVVSAHVHGHGLAICGNGAAVVDLHGGPGTHSFVKVRELSRACALDVVRRLRAAAPGTSFAIERTGGLHHEETYPPLHMEPGESVAPAEKLLAETLADPAVAEQPVLKVLAFHPGLAPDEFLVLARAAIGDRATVTRSSPSALLEISGPGISKASTLELCCAERGITPEEVVAFGDMPNDIEMLAWAGTSYAMGNAHPDVIAAASGRTVANNDDGVAVVIERIVADRRASDGA